MVIGFAKRSAVVVAAGAGLLGLSMVGALSSTATADATLVLYEHDTSQNTMDRGTAGPSPGDQFTFTGDVFDRPGGALLGSATGMCTTLTGDATAGASTCNVTFTLDGGQIVVQSLLDNGATFVRGEPNPLSIVGGTGIYRTARGDGTMQVPVDVPDQTDANFVLGVVTA